MHCLRLFLAIALIATSCAQTVTQQCLTQQFTITNPNNIPNQQTTTPAGITMAAFDSICRNFEAYVNCIQTGLPASNNPADRFLRLVVSRPDMERAYRGLCTRSLEALRPLVQCLLITPPVRACYNTFNQAVNQVVTLENQNNFPRATLQDMACNVSVARYTCETGEYDRCDPRVGQIMRDFFFAELPQRCRISARLTSRFVNNASAGRPQWSLLAVCTLAVIFLTTLIDSKLFGKF